MTAQKIVDSLEKKLTGDENRKILVTVKPGKIVHVNIIFLDHFLGTKKDTGMYISIDRPHKYIELLLKRKEVPQDRLYYLDIATRGDGGQDSRNLLSIGGFLWLKLLANTFEEVYRAGSERAGEVELEEMDFMLMDNASVLPAYNTMDSIREFFTEFNNIMEEHEDITALIVTPKDLHPKMLELLRNFVDDKIEIPDRWVA